MTCDAWLPATLAVICTAIGYTVWFIVIRECPVNVAALTIFAQSVFGVTIAVLWVGEKLHWGQLLGSLTIMAGLVLVLSRQIQRPANAANAGTQARLLQFGRITDHASRRHTQ